MRNYRAGLSLISQYDFAILYKVGSKHTNADFMSRSEPM